MKTSNTAKHQSSVKIKPTHEDVSRLAHALYEQAGRPDGKDREHWFNAEAMTEANFGYGKSHTEHDFSREAELK